MQVLIKVDDLLMKHLSAPDYAPALGGASQAFTRYRRKMKIGADVGEQSPYDFHFFLRCFITKAEQARQPPHIIDYGTATNTRAILGGPSSAQIRSASRQLSRRAKVQLVPQNGLHLSGHISLILVLFFCRVQNCLPASCRQPRLYI